MMFSYKEKGEEPRHPLSIAGFTSICNLITEDNITEMTKKVNQELAFNQRVFYLIKFILDIKYFVKIMHVLCIKTEGLF